MGNAIEERITADMDIKQKIREYRDKHYNYDKWIVDRKRHYSNLDELEVKLESSQFAIDLEGYHFECLFNEKRGEHLYVIYNGAKYKALPGFPRWGYHNLFDGSMLCLEDPMYYKYPDMNCGSFYGDGEKSCIAISIKIIKAVCKKMSIKEDKVIFFSSSQGGYSGIYASTLMPNTLSIALNPRLYIQDTPHTENFTNVSGINLNEPDLLHRNDIVNCIRNGSSIHVMLFNVQCDHDWIHHGQRFCKEFGIEPCYGITMKDNCLFWTYDCIGAPNPHTSFETKSIFMFIDSVSKAFYNGEMTEGMRRTALIINECWHDIFELKKDNIVLKKNQDPLDFIYIEGGKMHYGEKVNSLHNISINKKNVTHNFFRYNILSQNKKIYVCINGVSGSVEKITAGIFDFKNNKILHYEDFEISHEINICFATGRNIEGLALCVYAGIAGETQGQELFIENFEVYQEDF